MKRLLLIATAMLLATMAALAAPDIVCVGQVVDELDEPMPGVTISVPGTATATSTDYDGKYKLRVAASTKVIKISFIGYKTLEMAPAADMGVIKMSPESKMLSDVVITQSIGKTRETPRGHVDHRIRRY